MSDEWTEIKDKIIKGFSEKFDTVCCSAEIVRDEQLFLRCNRCGKMVCIGDCCTKEK